MDRIGSPLRDLLQRLRLTEPLESWKAIELWPDIAGETAARHARATAVRNGTLLVEVDSLSWATELSYRKHQFISAFAEHLGGDDIRDIRFSAIKAAGSPRERE